MNKCNWFKQINDYLDNRLLTSKKTQFEEHLKKCSVCAQEVERLNQVRKQLQAWNAPLVKEGFENSVRNKIVTWELERGDTQMKTKTSWFLIPAGAVVSIVMFLVVGQVYFKHTQYSHPGKPHTVELTQNQPVVYEKKSVAMSRGDLSKKKVDNALQEYVPYCMGDKVELHQSIKSVDSYGLTYSSIPPGVQYPAQSEFFEEKYSRIYDNDFQVAKVNPLSTFSIDVDTASYSNVRRFLSNNQLPPADAVRIEEIINYFTYDYPQPTGNDPFSINTEVAACPWNSAHKLALVGLQGKKMDVSNLPPSNLVFLIDVSGSMQDYNKLPLLESAFRLLVNQLRAQDSISIVTYAGASRVVLDSISGSEHDAIMQAIDGLSSGGSTAGAAGLVQAYEIAKKNLIKDGNNRVILATDGDFNVGLTSESELVRLIEERRDDGIFLTILGFGMGNYNDATMEQLADKGNGSTAYIDNLLEAKKVFVNQLTGTLFTIAKDVKIQVEFNPTKVKAYRLIGYENRKLENKDFNDDKKDAGELGAGHTVTALYEIVPADSKEEFGKTDDLKYQHVTVNPSDELLTVKLRYKEPKGDTSKLLSRTINAKSETVQPSENLRFASGVAEFGLLLRNSQYKANATYQNVLERVKAAKGADNDGYRADFIKLVEIAQMLDTKSK